MVYLFLSHLAFGQNENKSQNWEWQNFPAEKSTKKLDDFISKYRELSYDWEEEEYIAFLNKVFKAAKALEDKKALSYSSINLGGIYVQLDSFAQALYFLNYVIELDDGDRFMAYAYNDLGNLYSNVNNYSMALESYFKSVKYNKIVGDGEETYPLGNISDIYMALDDIDNAIKYTVACIPFSMSLDFPDNAYNLSNDYSRLIDFYNQKNDLDSCNHYIDLFLEVIQPIDTFLDFGRNFSATNFH
jgi:tetratricopeptide (TPR) repeat protein